MKLKHFILLLFTLSLPILASAIDNSPYVLGVHIDPIVSWFATDNNHFSGATPNVGMNAGLEFEYKFAKRYSFLTGAGIDLRGASLTYKESDYKLQTTYDGKIDVPQNKTLDTYFRGVAIPLALNMRAIEIGYTTFFATAGLHLSVPFNETARIGGVTHRTTGMYTPLFINYMLRLGIEYSLGGSSAVQCGLLFDGSFLNAYRTGHGAVDMYSLGLRVGFVF